MCTQSRAIPVTHAFNQTVMHQYYKPGLSCETESHDFWRELFRRFITETEKAYIPCVLNPQEEIIRISKGLLANSLV